MNFIRYINANPTTDDCSICLRPLSNNVVAHKKVIAIRKNPPLHPLHNKCLKAMLQHADTCPLCRAPIVPMCPLPTSLKEKLITVLKAGRVVAGVAAIAKCIQTLVTSTFTPDDMLLGIAGTIGGFIGHIRNETSPDENIKLKGATTGAVIGIAVLLASGKITSIAQKQLIERFGLCVVSGVGGVGATIGLAATSKVINTLMSRLPSLRNIDDEAHLQATFALSSILFGTTLVQKVAWKILQSLV